MSMPPPPMSEQTMPPKKPGAPLWIILSLVGCGLLCFGGVIVAAILFPVFAQARLAAKTSGCMSNMRQSASAMLLYSSDFEDHLPRTGKWMDAISPYHASESDFHCPEVIAKDPNAYGYAYHTSAQGKSLVTMDDIVMTPLIFDTTLTDRNALSDFSTLPTPGRHYRRGKGNIVGYCDGHVGVLKDDERGAVR